MNILIIDDSPDDRELIMRSLKRSGAMRDCHVIEAESGQEALQLLQHGEIDCALLDYSLPGSNGLEILNEVRLRHPDLPVVMITGDGNERIAVDAFRTGAADYISKNDISTESLTSAIGQACEAKSQEAETLRRANCDDLTGLANRRVFNDRLHQILQRSQHDRRPFGITFMDVDGLKPVNDSHGHDVGDQLLREVSERLAGNLRNGDLLARIGGDEFAAILENLPSDDRMAAQIAVDRLLAAVGGTPFHIGGKRLTIGISIGLALYPRMADNSRDLLQLADEAMYAMKNARREASPDGINVVRFSRR